MPTGVYQRTKECKLILSEALKKYWAKIPKEERLKRLDSWFRAGAKGTQTLKARRKVSEALRSRWAGVMKEERAGLMKIALKAFQAKFAIMTKNERAEFTRPMREAGTKAMGKKFAGMTKGEKLQATEAGRKAIQHANPSSIEKAIWNELDKLNINYKTQVSFNKGKFIVDIYIPSKSLIIECQGAYWHNYKIFPEKGKRDKALREYAKNNDYKLIELWEKAIRANPRLALENGLELSGARIK